jgi:hypothetical protein
MRDDIKRITIQVDPALYSRIQAVRHGFRGHLMAGLIKVALDAIEKDGDIMLGALIAGKYKLVPDYDNVA